MEIEIYSVVGGDSWSQRSSSSLEGPDDVALMAVSFKILSLYSYIPYANILEFLLECPQHPCIFMWNTGEFIWVLMNHKQGWFWWAHVRLPRAPEFHLSCRSCWLISGWTHWALWGLIRSWNTSEISIYAGRGMCCAEKMHNAAIISSPRNLKKHTQCNRINHDIIYHDRSITITPTEPPGSRSPWEYLGAPGALVEFATRAETRMRAKGHRTATRDEVPLDAADHGCPQICQWVAMGFPWFLNVMFNSGPNLFNSKVPDTSEI